MHPHLTTLCRLNESCSKPRLGSIWFFLIMAAALGLLPDWAAHRSYWTWVASTRFLPWYSGHGYLDCVLLNHLVHLVFYLKNKRPCCCLRLKFWVTGRCHYHLLSFFHRALHPGFGSDVWKIHFCRSVT